MDKKIRSSIKVIIPAYNEEKAIGKVISEIPNDVVDEVIVVDNASRDNTAAVAQAHGATVLHQPRKGYGWACLCGMAYIAEHRDKQPDIVVFLDGDHSDFPEEIPILLNPILEGLVDFVIGSRALGERERGAMTPQQIFGNWLATFLMKKFYGAKFTDLGPFRAIRYTTLVGLSMEDKTYGWTVEMQLKVAKQKIPYVEIPVKYRRRIGTSKVSGTVKGTILAGYKIIWTIFKYK